MTKNDITLIHMLINKYSCPPKCQQCDFFKGKDFENGCCKLDDLRVQLLTIKTLDK